MELISVFNLHKTVNSAAKSYVVANFALKTKSRVFQSRKHITYIQLLSLRPVLQWSDLKKNELSRKKTNNRKPPQKNLRLALCLKLTIKKKLACCFLLKVILVPSTPLMARPIITQDFDFRSS